MRRELPAEIDRVLQAVVEAEAAVGRMAVRGVAGDEHAADLVLLGDRDAQVPEADVVELGLERKAGRLLQQPVEIEIVPRGVLRHRRMEEEALADVDPAEELPVAVQVRVHRPVGRLRRKALAELLVQLARAEHDQHHELVEVVAAARNADLLAHDGMAAVAADDVIGLQHLARAVLGDGDARAARVLLDLGRRSSRTGLSTFGRVAILARSTFSIWYCGSRSFFWK